MKKQRLSHIVEDWEESGKVTPEMASVIEDRFEDIIQYEFGYLDDLVKKKKPHQAFGRLSRFLSLLNVTMQTAPSIQKCVETRLFNLRQRVDTIAKGMGADSYNLTLEMPSGISITLLFRVEN